MNEDDVIEVEPILVYPIKENHIYAICHCPFPMIYALDLGERIPNKTEYHFHCKRCGLNGFVIARGEN